jgi:hypothetical protein
MPPSDDWSGDDRRQDRRRILERRREARKDDLDRMIEKAGVTRDAKSPGARGSDRRETDRRKSQFCFVCRGAFVPEANGQTICANCTLDGVRGGSGGWKSPR